MPCPFLFFSQSDYLIQIADINSRTEWQTVQKPTDLDLHCLQRQGISGFSRTRVNNFNPSLAEPGCALPLQTVKIQISWFLKKTADGCTLLAKMGHIRNQQDRGKRKA